MIEVVSKHQTTKRNSQAKMKAAAPNDITGEEEDDDDDVGALIYREAQLRKSEAVATAAAESKASSASTHQRRISTKNRAPVKSQSRGSLPIPKRRVNLKRKRPESSTEEGRPRKKVIKKKYRYECSAVGCTNQLRKEECASGMEHSSNDAAKLDAQTKL